MLANVPLAMTASLPRREPYELNWRGTTPRPVKNLEDYRKKNMNFVKGQKKIKHKRKVYVSLCSIHI